jgi:hypothetical protein
MFIWQFTKDSPTASPLHRKRNGYHRLVARHLDHPNCLEAVTQGAGSILPQAQPLSASGTIRVLTHGKHGVVLSDGTVIHFPPPVGMQFSSLSVPFVSGRNILALLSPSQADCKRSFRRNCKEPRRAAIRARRGWKSRQDRNHAKRMRAWSVWLT